MPGSNAPRAAASIIDLSVFMQCSSLRARRAPHDPILSSPASGPPENNEHDPVLSITIRCALGSRPPLRELWQRMASTAIVYARGAMPLGWQDRKAGRL